MIEDSRNGLLAATDDAPATVITTSTYTTEEDFTGAATVVPELGDPPHVRLTLEDLRQIVAKKHVA